MVWMQSVGEEYQREIEGLQKKLKWYAENQQLLDQDSALLKQKDIEISQLADKLRQLRTDVSWTCIYLFILHVSCCILVSEQLSLTSELSLHCWRPVWVPGPL